MGFSLQLDSLAVLLWSSLGWVLKEVSWLSLLDVDDSLEEHPDGLQERWLGPVVDAVLLGDLLELWSECWVVVVADSWEQVVLNLVVEAERDVESKLGVLGKVHGVLDLSGGPALEVLGLWSPLLNHARDVADLGEGHEDGADTEHVDHPEHDALEAESVGQVRGADSVADEAEDGVWRNLGVALHLAHGAAVQGLVLDQAVSVMWSDNKWRVQE